jgi:hypothetical protein
VRIKRDEPDGGGEAHAAPVTSKAALLAFLLLFTTFLSGFSGTTRISMSFDRTGYHTIGHARPLRPNQRMGHFYISTGIDWAPNYTVESRLEPFLVDRGSCSPMVRPMSYIGNRRTRVLNSRYLRASTSRRENGGICDYSNRVAIMEPALKTPLSRRSLGENHSHGGLCTEYPFLLSPRTERKFISRGLSLIARRITSSPYGRRGGRFTPIRRAYSYCVSGQLLTLITT